MPGSETIATPNATQLDRLALTLADLAVLIDTVWTDAPDIPRICATGNALCEQVAGIGEAHFAALGEGSTSFKDPLLHQFYTFAWPDPAKRFLALWRNSAIEWERYLVLLEEGATTADLGQVLAKALRQNLQDAAQLWLESGTRQTLDRLDAQGKTRAAALYDWSLQDNPWPIYREQFGTL